MLHHLLDLAQTELDIHVREQTGQIVLTKIKYKVESRSVSIVRSRLGAANFDEINDVLVFE